MFSYFKEAFYTDLFFPSWKQPYYSARGEKQPGRDYYYIQRDAFSIGLWLTRQSKQLVNRAFLLGT